MFSVMTAVSTMRLGPLLLSWLRCSSLPAPLMKMAVEPMRPMLFPASRKEPWLMTRLPVKSALLLPVCVRSPAPFFVRVPLPKKMPAKVCPLADWLIVRL